jgi:uncharacterized protein YprB with RNaseH-like and TPR domain
VVDGDCGAFFLVRDTYEPGYRHGLFTLADLIAHPLKTAADLARDERLARVDWGHVAFIDTETTGLVGGTGTYAFLVGVGVFEDSHFTIHQFFMRDFHEELAQLLALGQLLDRLEAVVSFNGRTFDLPLLETRFIMARQSPRLVGAPHLDLLPVARRIWRHRLHSCALSSLESEVLGVRRTHADVPGWLIPGLYAEYTRSGDAREIARVFYHNAQDILSLVTLAARQSDLVTTSLPVDDDLPGEDLYGLGRLQHDLGHLGRAEAAYERAAQTCQSPLVRDLAMRDLAYLLKRGGQRGEALHWWQQLVEVSGAVYACEELAKHYEWHDGDLTQAVAWTHRGLTIVEGWPASSKRYQALASLNHRLERVNRKIKLGSREDEPCAG